MATTKSHTDLPQSKTLSKILSHESADMSWCNKSIRGVNYTDSFSVNLRTVKEMREVFDEALSGWDKYWELIPCWSLSALLSVLSYPDIKQRYDGKWVCRVENKDTTYIWVDGNPIDACVDMIEKLHERKIL